MKALLHVVLGAALGVAAVLLAGQVVTKSVPIVPVETVVEPDVMTVRTGDHFWGFRLDGVLECSSLLIKKGGYMVILSEAARPEAKLYYHVVDEKPIELAGKNFRLIVLGEDQARVERNSEARLAAN